jgi:hypothetical protein
MERNKVFYEAEEIKGKCPLYKVGDKIVIDSTIGGVERINLDESDAVCVRVIDNMWTRLTWEFGASKIVEHMYGVDGECRIICPMPGEPYTPCGYVIFRIRRDNSK